MLHAWDKIIKGLAAVGGAVAGLFGGETRAAVKSFQKGYGLSADGVCGPLMWAALLDAMQEVGCDVSSYFGVSVG